jgi:phosphoribosylformimino-5-aminoimidazole carboxamide ribotide isomerase
MLIPSIDLQGGQVVQLEQGERLVIASDDLDGWLDRFAAFPIVQVIDLDRAKRQGDNDALVRRIVSERRCQLGGGIRTPELAARWIDAGAARVIVGSALFEDGAASRARGAEFAAAVGAERLIAAVDARHGRVVIAGWREAASTDVASAVRTLEPEVGAFLTTFVEGEGRLGGVPLARASALRDVTTRRLIVAGGVRSHDEVDALDAMGIDAVVGMALYTGLMPLERTPPA